MNQEQQKNIAKQIFEGVKFVFETKKNQYKGEKPYSKCCIQEGYFDYLRISVLKSEVKYSLYDFSWDSYEHKLKIPQLENIFKVDFAVIAKEIMEKVQHFFLDSTNQPLFRYKLRLILDFESKMNDANGNPLLLTDRIYSETFYFEDINRKKELQNVMKNYIKELVFDQKIKVKSEREARVLCEHLTDFGLMEYSETEAITMIERLFETMQFVDNKAIFSDFKSSIIFNLREWSEKEFLPLYCDVVGNYWMKEYVLKKDFSLENVDENKLELYVYQSYLQIKYKDGYTQFAQKELQRAAKDFGSKKAQMYLKKGTGTLPDSLIHFKDTDLECKANDVFAQVEIKLKNETAESYDKALNFLINLLKGGFVASYYIKFSSKGEKKFLPIKGLAKSATHRFFAQALQFAELFPKLESYAQVAMKEFEWYEDVEEGEKSCMPSSYAVFGLGLEDEKYFPLVKKYLDMVDDEHQLVHYDFLEVFIEKWGITEKSLSIICKGALSGQFQKPFKNISKRIKEEDKLLIDRFLLEYDSHEKEIIKHMIFGKSR